MNKLRHIQCVCIPAHALERLVRDGVMMRCIRGVPVDAKLVGMQSDHLRDGFVLAFEHPSFPLVDLGCEAPITWAVLEEIDAP